MKFPKPTHKKKAKVIEEKICKVCKKTFTSKSCDRRGWLWKVAKFCSKACSAIGRRTKETRKCRVCQKEYKFATSQLKKYKGAGKFCSKRCHGDWVIQVGRTKSITDRFGRTKRHDDVIWQKAIREKDNSTCRRCGKYDIYINTHHINPRGRRPDLKHDVSNGMCLCNECHGWVHTHILEALMDGFLSKAKYENK